MRLYACLGALLLSPACASSNANTAATARSVSADAAAAEAQPVMRVTGRVTNMEGTPVSKVTVHTNPPTECIVTGDEGTFDFGIPAGTYTLVVTDGSGEVVEQELNVAEAATAVGDVKIEALGDVGAIPECGEGKSRPVESGGRD